METDTQEHVFFVDDESKVRRVVRRTLERAGLLDSWCVSVSTIAVPGILAEVGVQLDCPGCLPSDGRHNRMVQLHA